MEPDNLDALFNEGSMGHNCLPDSWSDARVIPLTGTPCRIIRQGA